MLLENKYRVEEYEEYIDIDINPKKTMSIDSCIEMMKKENEQR